MAASLMRVAQVSRPEGPFRDRGTADIGAGRRVGADQGSGMRHLPQRFTGQGGAVSGDRVPSGSRA